MGVIADMATEQEAKLQAIEAARKIKSHIENDPDAFGDGRRNADTVDYCIACWMLGIDDPWTEAISRNKKLRESDPSGDRYIRTRCKFKEVDPYHRKWCFEGREYKGLRYLVRSMPYYERQQ